MTDREIFRKNLINLMNISKVKQIDIAKYAEVSQQTVSAWVNGRGYPRADAMEKLCRFFGIKQSTLTEDKNADVSPEDVLLASFRSLSETGRQKMLERASELIRLYPKRSKKNAKTETAI